MNTKSNKNMNIVDKFTSGFFNKEEDFEITLFASEYNYIVNCVLEFNDIETGGDLFGSFTNSGNPLLHYVLGPGPNVRRNVTSFYQDRDYLNNAGNILIQKYALRHIGEWHSHHQLGLSEPSSGDINTIKSTFANPKYSLSRFILFICNIHGDDVKISPYIFYRSTRNPNDIKLNVCELSIIKEQSITRDSFDSKFPEYVYHPKISKSKIDNFNQKVTSSNEKADFPKDSWLCNNDGKEYLKSIHKDLLKYFEDVKIFPNNTGSVFLEAQIKGHAFIINFPNNFPQEKPLVRPSKNNDEKYISKINNKYEWKQNSNTVSYILNCIESYIKSGKIIIEIK